MIRRRGSRASADPRFAGRGWFLAVALVVGLGIAGAVLSARAVGRSDEQGSKRRIAIASADIVSSLRLALQQDADLVVGASAFVVANPGLTNAAFNKWAQADKVKLRYPEVLALGRIVVIPRSRLSSFAARASRGSVGSRAAGGSFKVIPPGARPFYCFLDLNAGSQLASAAPVQPAGIDFCASGGVGPLVLGARDSGKDAYEPFRSGKVTELVVETPLYLGGRVPATVAARRAAFIGVIGVELSPAAILAPSLQGHPEMAVTLRHRAGTDVATFTSGTASTDAESTTALLPNGWSVETSGRDAASGIFANRSALAVLIAGLGLTGLLGLLAVVLVTGRARALRLVRKQTVELRASIDELEAAHSVKDEFLALVSHELRTPLTSIQGYAELLQGEDLDADQHDYVEVIDRSSARLLSIVEDLLLMAEIQSGGLPLHLSEVVLNELIVTAGEAAEPFAAGKNIDLEIDIEPHIATQGDHVRLGQVIDNLLSNAIKYTPNGGDVSVTMTRIGETATIAIADTGIGIPGDEQAEMFGRFFRTSNARNSGIAGSGLGLAITRGIVEAHGGTIGFTSVEGVGTTFRVSLPLAYGVGLESAA